MANSWLGDLGPMTIREEGSPAYDGLRDETKDKVWNPDLKVWEFPLHRSETGAITDPPTPDVQAWPKGVGILVKRKLPTRTWEFGRDAEREDTKLVAEGGSPIYGVLLWPALYFIGLIDTDDDPVWREGGVKEGAKPEIPDSFEEKVEWLRDNFAIDFVAWMNGEIAKKVSDPLPGSIGAKPSANGSGPRSIPRLVKTQR